MRLDLGGIAKGFAADEALAVLGAHGITRALVAAGGDIVVSGPPLDREGWSVEVALPPPLHDPGGTPWSCATRRCRRRAMPSSS